MRDGCPGGGGEREKGEGGGEVVCTVFRSFARLLWFALLYIEEARYSKQGYVGLTRVSPAAAALSESFRRESNCVRT